MFMDTLKCTFQKVFVGLIYLNVNIVARMKSCFSFAISEAATHTILKYESKWEQIDKVVFFFVDNWAEDCTCTKCQISVLNFDSKNARSFANIVTGDDTWVYLYE